MSVRSDGIPQTWLRISLGNIAEIVTGKTPPTADPANYDGDIPFLTPADLGSSIHPALGRITITTQGAEHTRLLPPQSVLVCCIGATIGKVGLTPVSTAVNQQINALVFDETIVDSRFGYYYCTSFRDHLREISSSTTLPIVNKTRFSKIEMPVPPLGEQHRIVARIEELFSDLDAGVETLRTVQQQLKVYRQLLLKWAFEGKLTEKWRQAQQLAGTLPTRQALLSDLCAATGKTQEAIESGEQGCPSPPLPDEWIMARFASLCSSIRNGISEKPDGSNGDRILRISSVRPCYVDLHDYRYIPNSEGQYTNFLLQRDDLLFTRYNGSRKYVGVCARFSSNERFLYPDKLIRVQLSSPSFTLPQYIEFAANSGMSRAHIESRIRTTAGQSGISGEDIKSMPVPICGPAEQQQLVCYMEARLSTCDELDAMVNDTLIRAESLRQSILKNAFEGKLVKQNPEDEPVEELLKRISQRRPNQTARSPLGKKVRGPKTNSPELVEAN